MELTQMKIRLPKQLRQVIQRSAKQLRRSMNSEIVFQLEQIYQPPKENASVVGATEASKDKQNLTR